MGGLGRAGCWRARRRRARRSGQAVRRAAAGLARVQRTHLVCQTHQQGEPMILATASAAASSPTSSLGLDDFVRVLTTQLTSQDPLKPMDNQAFMAQMAQFTALEQTQQLNDRVQQLIDNQAALQSVGLIGRSIDFNGASGRTTGTVTALSLQGDAPVLSVALADGTVLGGVGLGQLISVR